MKFEEKLIKLRKQNALSQEELAEKLNVTRQTISKWELGQSKPDMDKLIELSKLFEMSLDELTNDLDITNSEDVYKESSVEKNNKKISVRILIIGIIIACILCGVGFLKQKGAEKTNEQTRNDAYALSQSNVDKAQKRLNEIIEQMNILKTQIDNLDIEITKLKNEQNVIFREDRNFSDRYYAKDNEIKVKQTELSNLKQQYNNLDMEGFALQNDDYTVYYNEVEPIKYLIFYYIGAGVLGLTILISLIYFLVTRRKK